MLGTSAQKSSQRSVPAAITDVGCEREINEDRYAVVDCPAGKVWLVCDGMGGVMGGELAAQLAIDAIRRTLENSYDLTSAEALQQSIQEANRVIVLRRQNPAFSAMGTTIVATMICDEELILSHAGDSRAYLVRKGEIQQLTVDHTYVQDLVESGAIGEEEALSHPQAHVLTRCIGAEPHLRLSTQRFWIWPTAPEEVEDILLLVSDGLYSLVESAEMAEMITKFSPQQACIELVELAKARGGYDNITIGVIPLDGHLREEAPNVIRKSKRTNKRPIARNQDESSLSFMQQIIVVSLLTVIGAISGGMLAIVWNM